MKQHNPYLRDVEPVSKALEEQFAGHGIYTKTSSRDSMHTHTRYAWKCLEGTTAADVNTPAHEEMWMRMRMFNPPAVQCMLQSSHHSLLYGEESVQMQRGTPFCH